MRTFFLYLFAAMLLYTVGFGQNKQDVIQLKNGDVRKGEIIENVPNEYVKIETSDGSIFTIKYSEIQKMTKEEKSTTRQSSSSEPAAHKYRKYEDVNRSEQSAFSLGGIFGLNFANLGGDNTSSLKSTTLVNFGAVATYNIIDQFGLQGELLYNQKGCKSEGTDANNNNAAYTTTQSFKYLEIEILAKYILPIEGPVKPCVFAGPAFGIKLGANVHWEEGTQSGDNDVSSAVSGADFGLMFGVGVDIKLGSGKILFDAGYDLGLANIQKTGTVSNTNQVIGLSLGYIFPL